MNLRNVYENLVALGLVSHQTEFSVNWLGKASSYMSCLLARGREPSVEALLALATRTTRAIALLRQAGRPEDAAIVDKISGDVWIEIFERSILPEVAAAENVP